MKYINLLDLILVTFENRLFIKIFIYLFNKNY